MPTSSEENAPSPSLPSSVLIVEKSKRYLAPLLLFVLLGVFWNSISTLLLFPYCFFEDYFSSSSLLFGRNLSIIFLLLWFLLSYCLLVPLFPLVKDTFSKHSFSVFVKEKDWYSLLIVYPSSLFIEELVFRGLLISYLIQNLSFLFNSFFFLCFIASLLFSLYHFHIFFSSRDLRLTLIFIVFSLDLGLLLNLLLPYLGILGAWLLHISFVTPIYLIIFKKTYDV